jgi:amino acid adenylation domain-containing protein
MINQNAYPISSLQQAMLLPSLISQNTDTYLEQVICDWKENINVEVLKKSWQEVIRHYEVLRTYFDWQSSSRIVQLIDSEIEVPWREVDWSDLSLSDQIDKVQEYLKADRLQGFPLNKPPLLRLTLGKLSNDRYKLIWTFHHSILDGRSIILILKEVFAYYRSLQQHQSYQMAPVTPYREFINFLTNQPSDHGQSFWQKLLAGFTKKVDLSARRIQQELKSYLSISDQLVTKNNICTTSLSTTITSQLQSLATTHDFTFNTLIQGVYALALGKCSGRDDVVFGATRACRQLPIAGIETMTGLLINTVPVRVKINPELTILELLQELRSQWVAIRDYETTSLNQIHQWSDLTVDHALFDTLVMFEYRDLTHSLNLPNCHLEIKEQINLPLSLAAYGGEQLYLNLGYNPKIYDSETVSLFLIYLTKLLTDISLNPHQKISDLLAIAPAKHQPTFLDLFSQQVEQNPQQLAVVTKENSLTYQQLQDQSDLLALRLREMGVKADVLVGICVERSLEMMVGILAILKAGGAYVPIDPKYPQERISYILQDIQASILLSQSWLVEKMPEFPGMIICLDKNPEQEKQDYQDYQNNLLTNSRLPKPSPYDLAYIIYTSGSTGSPKGVMIEHQALYNFVLTHSQKYELKSSDRTLQFAALNFDVSVAEIFPSLASGSTIYLRTQEMSESISTLLEQCRAWQLTVLCLPTAFWHHLVDQLVSNHWKLPSTVRTVVIGGEKIQKQRVAIWLNYVGKYPHLVNAYGPTEATVEVAAYWISEDDQIVNQEAEIPIGTPSSHVKTYILDDKFQPVTSGVAGELYLQSVSLARGYLNRQDLTAKSFVNIELEGKQLRCYKTGDRATRLPDGNLVYLDRIDRQVKIRGYRIELGEIEGIVQQYSTVQDAVVLAKEKDDLGRYLVGYVVPQANQKINLEALRDFLQDRLPDYMIPRTFLVLPELPITINGKIAYSLLPTPEFAPNITTIIAPTNPTETLLIKLWTEVFKSPVGIHDNFWDLGGDSLVALRLFSLIEKEFQQNLPLTTLIQLPTIHQLSNRLQSQGLQVSWRSLVPIQPQGSRKPFFCIHPVGGNVLCYQNLIPYLSPDQPVYGLQAQGLDGTETAIDDIKVMANKYLQEIQTIQPIGPYILGGYSFGGTVAYEVAQQLQQAGQEVTAVIFFNSINPQIFKRRVLSPKEKMAIHISNLAQLTPRQKSKYINYRVGVKLEVINKRLVDRIYNFLKRPNPSVIPDYLLRLEAIHNYALENYDPQPYHGRIIQFQTIEKSAKIHPNPSLGWDEIVTGKIDIVDGVPGHHGTMLETPQIAFVGKKLQEILEEIHSSSRGASPSSVST